jgi:23S rRNA pseudouridine1911/1915/1917 synthase
VAPPRYLVGESEDGQRLDTRSRAWSAVALAGAPLDRRRPRALERPRCSASQIVAEGDSIDASPPEPIPRARCPRRSRCASSTRTRDRRDRQVGRHGGAPGARPRGGTLVNALLHHCGALAAVGGVLRPGNRAPARPRHVGRDGGRRSTTTRTARSRSSSTRIRIERVYQALVRGIPSSDRGASTPRSRAIRATASA